jgi:purine-binding chemotaxis protein CheW
MVEVSPLPAAPPLVLGVIDVQGEIVPVFDARRRFGLPVRAPSPGDQLIIARRRAGPAALAVDAVLDVVTAAPEQVVAADHCGGSSELVDGVVKLADGIVLIHDLDRFLSPTEETGLRAAMETTR